MGVEEKGYDANEGYAVTVSPGLFVWVAGNHHLPEVVAYMAEREGLLFALLAVGYVSDTSTKQMLFEEVEEKKTLPTTPYTNQNLDQIMVFRLYQLVQKDISFDNHYHVSALMLCASARKFKTQVFYNNAVPRSMSALNFCASAQKRRPHLESLGVMRIFPQRGGNLL